MRIYLRIAAAVLLVSSANACSQPKPAPEGASQTEQTSQSEQVVINHTKASVRSKRPASQPGKDFEIEGTMKHTDLEGGCWYLEENKKGTLKKYEILGDAESLAKLHHEDRWVRLVVKPEPNTATICMVGSVVRVLVIVDTVRHPVDIGWTRIKARGWFGKTKSGCWYLRTTKGLELELQQNVLVDRRKVGRRFSGVIKYIPGLNVNCKLDGVLIDAEIPKPAPKSKIVVPAPKPKIIVPARKYDPR